MSQNCQDGKFGSTQGTILALKAIIAYDKASFKLSGSGNISLKVDEKVVQTIPFSSDSKHALEFDGEIITTLIFDNSMKRNHHTLSLSLASSDSAVAMPFSFSSSYRSLLPSSSPNTAVSLTTSLSKSYLREGEGADLLVELKNVNNKEVPMTVAIIGIPGGMECRHDQLSELKRRGDIAFFEVVNSDLIIYWRGLAPSQKISLRVDVVAKIPGTFTGAASRAYLYYSDEFKVCHTILFNLDIFWFSNTII